MRGQKVINLALQGGGAHGAFTWGVLDQLLADGRLDFHAVSGTSAGAMNAIVLAAGLEAGGKAEARDSLARFWHTMGDMGKAGPVQRTLLDRFFGSWSLDNSPAYLWMDVMSRFWSPYDLNPLNINPLRSVLEASIDFDAVRTCQCLDLHISATNVQTGKVRVFANHEITPDAVLASACLPFLFQAVEIDGVPYWDGGYMGNPVLFPFFQDKVTADILLVQINPIERAETPKTARDILNRVNEITFNASLLREFRAIEFVQRLIAEGKVSEDEYTNVRMHRIADDQAMGGLSASSKMLTEMDFLLHLRDAGRAAADRWLEAHYDQVGEEGTLCLKDAIAYPLEG